MWLTHKLPFTTAQIIMTQCMHVPGIYKSRSQHVLLTKQHLTEFYTFCLKKFKSRCCAITVYVHCLCSNTEKPVDLSYSNSHFFPSWITSSCAITEAWRDCIFRSKRITSLVCIWSEIILKWIIFCYLREFGSKMCWFANWLPNMDRKARNSW